MQEQHSKKEKELIEKKIEELELQLAQKDEDLKELASISLSQELNAKEMIERKIKEMETKMNEQSLASK